MTEWSILDVIPLGVVLVNRSFTVVGWNRWMEMYSGISSGDIEGTSIFHHYPDLNRPSFLRSCRTVFTFGNVVYLSQKLHQYLFPIHLYGADDETGLAMMQQSCSMTPIRSTDGEIEMIAITVQDVTDSVVLEKRLRLLNQIDSLTGAYNRRFLDQRIREELDRHRRYDRSFSVVMFDLDHFKAINDERGHGEGDRVLQVLSTIVSEEIRSSDFFCRYGGEEFVLLLPETGELEAQELAERIRVRLQQWEFRDGDSSYFVTASFGVNSLSGETENEQDLLAGADERMYAAKNAGRNRIVPPLP
jgi:diguanylate cyclase